MQEPDPIRMQPERKRPPGGLVFVGVTPQVRAHSCFRLKPEPVLCSEGIFTESSGESPDESPDESEDASDDQVSF